MIPTNEQPYPLPNDWQWVRLGDVTKNQYGYTAKALKNDSLPKMLRITDIQNGAVNWHEVPNCEIDNEQKKKYLLQDNDIVIARTGATTGKSYIISNPINSVFASYLIRLQISKPINVRYLYYFLQSDLYWQQISELSAGIAQPGVNSSKLKRMPFPLPPLDEQQRIVSLLDELFADLDAAKALAQSVVDGSELRRTAILHKAFTGELSQLWREEHGTTLDSWQRRTVASVCKGLIYGTSKKSKSFGKMIVLRMGNLQCGKIDWKDLAYSDDEADIKKYLLSKGDVLFNRTNSAELVGKTSIYRGEYPAIYAGYLIKLDYDRDVLSGEYLNYVLNSPAAKEYCNHVKTDGVNQSNINAKKIGAYVIPLPPPEEQKEIVRLLDDLLGREQQTKNLAGKTLEHIEILRKSILSRVFRGELVLGGQF